MKDSRCVSACSSEMRGQKGSSVYSFLGFAIIAVVVVATFMLWGEMTKSPDQTMAAAKKAMAAKDWSKAIILYEKAIKANQNNAEAYVGLSRANVQLGKLDKALAAANAAVQKKPGSAIAYGQRGIVEKIQQKPEEALRDFSKAVQLDNTYSWAYAQRGDIYLKRNELDKALLNVNQALRSKGNFVEGLRLRAWVLNGQGKCKEAFEDFKKVEALTPNDPWSIQDRAWFLMTCPDEKIQDSAKALELAQKAVAGPEGKDGVILEVLAEAYFKQGDAAKAAEYQKKALELGSKKCPDNSCTKEMKERLQKYELASRQEIRSAYEILPLESTK